MNTLAWILICTLSALAAVFAGRLAVVHRDLAAIAEGFMRRVEEDWNAPLMTGSGNRYVLRFVRKLNEALAAYRAKRSRYEMDDTHLREKITNLAHDLRTPLTAVMGYLDILEDQPETARKYLPVMRGRIELMAALTGELFEYSLSTSGRPAHEEAAVDVRTLLEDAVIGLYPLFTEHGTEPVIQLPEEPVPRRTDRRIAERLFGNILTNAIRHGTGAVHITLETDGTVRIANRAEGLEPLDLEKMFDRYYTVKDAGRTTGLGLGIARTLAAELGGTVQASLTNGILEIAVKLPDDGEECG